MKKILFPVILLLFIAPNVSATCLTVNDILTLNNISATTGQNSTAFINVFENICQTQKNEIQNKINNLSGSIPNDSSINATLNNFITNYTNVFTNVNEVKNILLSVNKFDDIRTEINKKIEEVNTKIDRNIEKLTIEIHNISSNVDEKIAQVNYNIQTKSETPQDNTILIIVLVAIAGIGFVIYQKFGFNKKENKYIENYRNYQKNPRINTYSLMQEKNMKNRPMNKEMFEMSKDDTYNARERNEKTEEIRQKAIKKLKEEVKQAQKEIKNARKKKHSDSIPRNEE